MFKACINTFSNLLDICFICDFHALHIELLIHIIASTQKYASTISIVVNPDLVIRSLTHRRRENPPERRPSQVYWLVKSLTLRSLPTHRSPSTRARIVLRSDAITVRGAFLTRVIRPNTIARARLRSPGSLRSGLLRGSTGPSSQMPAADDITKNKFVPFFQSIVQNVFDKQKIG